VVSRGMSNKCVSIRRNKLLSGGNQNNIIGQLLKVGDEWKYPAIEVQSRNWIEYFVKRK